MPCLNAPAFSKSVTITADTITVDATTDIWRGQIGVIQKAGVTSRRVKVTDVPSTTTFRAKYEPLINDDNFARDSVSGAGDAGYPGSAAANNLAAYTGGTITFDAQLVETAPDYSKPKTS